MNNKFREVSILKGLGIIAVVLGHVGSPLTNMIYMYHMGLFFFISGYLYKDSCEENLFKYIIKKFKSLYIPFIVFELIFISIRNILIDLHVYDITQINRINGINDFIENLKNIITFNGTPDTLLGAAWFLKVLFYVSILYAMFNIVFKKIFKEENEFLKCLIIVIISVVSFDLIETGNNIGILLNPNNRKLYKLFTDLLDVRNFIIMGVFYMGNLYKKIETKIPMNIYMAIISFISIYYNSKIATIDVSQYSFVGPIFFIFNTLLGVYLNIYIARKICSSKYKFNIIEDAGKYSLYIMVFHLLACKILDILIINIFNLPIEVASGYPVTFYNEYMWISYTIVGTIIPIILTKFYNNIRVSIKNISNTYKNNESVSEC